MKKIASFLKSKTTKRLSILIGSILIALALITAGFYTVKFVKQNNAPKPDHLALARDASSTSDYAKAESEYLAYIKERGEDPKIGKELAFVYQYEHKSDDAIAQYEKSLTTSELRDVGSVNNLANLYRDKQQYDKAEQLYLEAITKNANFTLAMINLNHLYILQGQYDKAIALMQKYFDNTKQKIEIGIQLYSDYKLANKSTEASNLLNELKRLDPDNPKLK